jgi:hypothetical protein
MDMVVMEPLMYSERRFSSFSVSNNTFTSRTDPKYRRRGYGPTGLSLANTISIDIPALRTEGEVSFYNDRMWLAGMVLYAKYREFEMIRISFETLKHSLLIINPLEKDNFKNIERSLDSEKIQKLLQGMRPIRAAFCFSRTLFGDPWMFDAGIPIAPRSNAWLLFTLSKGRTFDLSAIGITDGMELNRFTHRAYFKTSNPIRASRSMWSELDKVKPEALAARYEKVLPLESPFLFFVIDDPTGAILIMGRLRGNGAILTTYK